MNAQAQAAAAGLLQKAAMRLRSKSLFGAPGDSLSVRIPGYEKLVLALEDREALRLVRMDEAGDEAAGLHAAVYRTRADAGAVLVGRTPWSAALSNVGIAVPTLFDEQARHIGKMEKPVEAGRRKQALEALRSGGNVVLCGEQRICVGTTADRVVFNADLFEKCTKAFLITYVTGETIQQVPRQARAMAGRRLEEAQKRAAASYESGRIPEGMDAY